ncbi:MAG: hypothetical protein WCL39_13905, partial [Armatimonadota bacterium]
MGCVTFVRKQAMVLLGLISGIGSACAATLPGTRISVDWPALVSRQDIVLSAPASDTVHGLLLGNGDIGVSVFGTADAVILQVGKND